MEAINTFDTALREEFEQQGHDAGVVFLRADPTGRVIPCSPNKILLSTVTTLRPGSRFLPVGFSTDAKLRAIKHVQAIDEIIAEHVSADDEAPFVISIDSAEQIIDRVDGSLVMDVGHIWDVQAFKAMLRHLAYANANSGQAGEVACMIRRDRDLSKIRPSGRLQSAPDSRLERETMEQYQEQRPALLLYRQNGKREQGWGNCEFWWPVLRAPTSTLTVIFARDTVD